MSTLTSCQEQTFDRVRSFFRDGENPAIVINGAAGVGKSFLTKLIVDHISDNEDMAIAAVAPTHKARRVLHSFLNKDRFIPVASMTVASVLGKMREHSYIGTHKYSSGSKQKMDQFDCFILDEVSMVSDRDLEEILDYICEQDKKIILIGDSCQIPSPSQQLERADGMCSRPDSFAFDVENVCTMSKIVRQVEDSVIIVLASYIRDNLLTEMGLSDILSATGVPEKDVVIPMSQLYDAFVEDRKSNLDTRIIAYTNAAVRAHNTQIRKSLGYTTPLVFGELLTGYANLGFPIKLIENGTDYTVSKMSETFHFKIARFTNLTGRLVDLADIDDPTHISNNMFFIAVEHSNNAMFMRELVRRAERVNGRRSTKDDFKEYFALKNRAVFLEDVFKYGDKIITETDMKQLHPLLFVKAGDVIDTVGRKLCSSELTEKIEEQYGDILADRLKDNKAFSDGETLADKYVIVEKDIYYGYALTGHKCCHKDTLVASVNGLQSIERLAMEICPGLKSHTTKQASFMVCGREGLREATQVYKGGVEATIRVTTRLGYTLEGSHQHPVLTYGGDEVWKKLPDLCEGDSLVLRIGTECYGTPISTHSFSVSATKRPYICPHIVDASLSYMLGLLVGDGCYSTVQGYPVDLTVHQDCADIIQTYHAAFEGTFGLPCKQYNQKSTATVRLMVNSKFVRSFLLWCGLEYVTAEFKTVPWCVLQNTKQCHTAFLRGLYDSDGGVNDGSVHFTTVSKLLAQQVSTMLLNIGIVSSFKSMTNNSDKPHKQVYRIAIYSHNAHRFSVEIGFVDTTKREKLNALLNRSSNQDVPKANYGAIPGGADLINRLRDCLRERNTPVSATVSKFLSRIINGAAQLRQPHLSYLIKNIPDLQDCGEVGKRLEEWYTNGVFFDHIVSVEEHTAQVYDIYVPDGHSFVGNGIVNHNSQGSTYESVYVDENDFDKIKSRWNFRFGCMEDRTKERNQLRYVSWTRASRNLRIIQ